MRRPRLIAEGSMYTAIYGQVKRIPRGCVVTYGQVAKLAGYPGRARQVGYALAATPEDLDLPWHRVVSAQGRVLPRSGSGMHRLQRALLEAEGVSFHDERIDLERFRWREGEGERD